MPVGDLKMRRRPLGRTLLVVMIAAACLPVAAAPAYAITRDEVLARAQTWINHPVPYSQVLWYPSKTTGYRQDCSGYVSMCWNITSSGAPYSTSTPYIHDYSYPIAAAQLKTGDVLLWAGHHVRLFVAWADSAHTRYVAYEQTPPQTLSSIKVLSTDLSTGYVPYRYSKITDTVPSWNLFENGSFEMWSGGLPVPSTFYSSVPKAAFGTATDLKRTGSAALRIVNPGTSVNDNADMMQAFSVTPGNLYAASVWARGTSLPGRVQLHILFRDSAGQGITSGGVDGSAFGVNPTAFSQISLTATAPPGAAQAVVYLRVTGGTSGSAVGGAAVFDDAAAWVASPLPVYRFFNRKMISHFYTASGAERDAVIDSLSSTYLYEGISYFVKTNVAGNDHPLYRFLNKLNGTYFYTASESEKNEVLAKLPTQMQLDGVAYKVCATALPGATPVYRFLNKKNYTHFYTASETERANTAKATDAYTYEGVGFYLAQ